MRKYTLVLDFDGVIHSYDSGWKGARVIPDAPVPGALEFISNAVEHFEVNIFSSRSHHWGGIRAMKRWMYHQLDEISIGDDEAPRWWIDRVASTAFADPWTAECQNAARRLIKQIHWPLFKPPAFITIDDRALTFTGTWPSIKELQTFKPWNKK